MVTQFTPSWSEKYDSRGAQINIDQFASSSELKFTLTGTENDSIVRNTVESRAPKRHIDLFLQDYTIEHRGNGVWDVVCHYGLADPEEILENFDTTGANTHISQSLATIGRHKAGGLQAPDLKGAINYDGDNVRGTDIPVASFAWNEQHTIQPERFTAAYRATLVLLTYRVNTAAFRGFAAGEVQFQGCQGSRRGRQHPIQLTYYFAAEPNLTNIAVGSINVPSKKGWELLWVRYAKKKDPGGDARIITEPDAAYVEKVHEEGDFSQLGIGIA